MTNENSINKRPCEENVIQPTDCMECPCFNISCVNPKTEEAKEWLLYRTGRAC